MDLLLLPDFLAISLLVYVLFRVRGGRNEGAVGMWTVALLLIVLEGAAHIVYGMRTARPVHLLAHVLALNAYGVAGATFLFSASQLLQRVSRGKAFLLINVVPHLMLYTAYGFELHSRALYWAIAACGLLAGTVLLLLLRLSSPLYLAFALVWAPLLLCLGRGDFHTATYMSLFFLYGLSAVFFWRSLPSTSHGRVAVVAGFSMWAICFLTHPWIATEHPEWMDLVNQFWNMQKFIITVGLLLVLLEDQVRSNEWLALHDGLTGLPNRRLFEDRLQHALINAERTRGRLALFTLDLDGFKQVNDSLGHDAGDCLLKGVSKNLLDALRRSDTLARMGGDEFALLATDLDGVAGSRLAHAGSVGVPGVSCAAARMPQVQRILTAMSQAVELPVGLGETYDGRSVNVTASIGVVVYPDEGTTAEDLMRLADQRMYRSKRHRAQRSKQAEEKFPECDLQQA